MVIVATIAGVITAWLLLSRPGGSQLCRLGAPILRSGPPPVMATICLAATASLVCAAALGGFKLLGWVTSLVILVSTVGGIGWRAVLRRRSRIIEAEVTRAARIIAGQLRIGKLSSAAVLDAAEDCPVLQPAAASLRIGGDVSGVLRTCAAQPGQAGLAAIAAAWDLSQRSGAPIADVIDQVAENLKDENMARSEVAVEVAGARMTGRIMAVLPFAGVGLGYLGGADPIAFLTKDWVGEVCFLVGVGLSAVGVWWLELLSDRALRT